MKESGEMYLETIYKLSSGSAVKSVDVAGELGVSRPSVNKAINMLISLGYAEKDYYSEITLTEAGRKKAKEIIFKHDSITDFLVKSLNMDRDAAEKDACRIEHVISDDTVNRMVAFVKSKS